MVFAELSPADMKLFEMVVVDALNTESLVKDATVLSQEEFIARFAEAAPQLLTNRVERNVEIWADHLVDYDRTYGRVSKVAASTLCAATYQRFND